MLDPGLLTKEWFRKYRSSEKLAFITLLCVCDEIGVWTIDVEWAEMLTGCRVDWKALVELIPDYFRFQYPRASRNNPVWAKLYKKADDSPHRQLLSLPNLQTVDTSVVSQSPIPRYQGGASVVRKEEEKEKVSLSSGVREDSSGDVGEEGVGVAVGVGLWVGVVFGFDKLIGVGEAVGTGVGEGVGVGSGANVAERVWSAWTLLKLIV